MAKETLFDQAAATWKNIRTVLRYVRGYDANYREVRQAKQTYPQQSHDTQQNDSEATPFPQKGSIFDAVRRQTPIDLEQGTDGKWYVPGAPRPRSR